MSGFSTGEAIIGKEKVSEIFRRCGGCHSFVKLITILIAVRVNRIASLRDIFREAPY